MTDSRAGAPRVSVVVESFNRPRLLRRALDSLAAQTMRDFEVIVVNDGGIDVSGVVGVNRGIDVRLVHHATNLGRAYTFNTGLAQARGGIVTFVPDDDVCLPNRLEVTADAMERLGPGHAMFTSVLDVLENEEGDIIESIEVHPGPVVYEDLLVSITVPPVCTAYPTTYLRDIGGMDTNLRIMGDWELFLRVAEKLAWVHVPVVTTQRRLRMRPDNASASEKFRYRDAIRYIYAKHPVPEGSDVAARRRQLLESDPGPSAEEWVLHCSFVIVCDNASGSLEATVASVMPCLTGDLANAEILVLVPDTLGTHPARFLPSGAVKLMAMGDIGFDDAVDFASLRANGRHVVMLRAGQTVDDAKLRAALDSPRGEPARIGR